MQSCLVGRVSCDSNRSRQNAGKARLNSALAGILWTVAVYIYSGRFKSRTAPGEAPGIFLALPNPYMVPSLCGSFLDGSAIILITFPAKLRFGVLPAQVSKSTPTGSS